MFVFVFVKQLTCHPSRRLGQTVPCPPRVGSLGAAQLEGLARVLYQPQPRVQTGLAEVEAAYHRKLHSDLEETKRAAISASELPSLSCGSGEDFKNMNALDRYDKLLRSGGLVAKRDIVQFVEMKQFVLGGGAWNKELLARSVLAEVPYQLASYMKMQSFNPLVRT